MSMVKLAALCIDARSLPSDLMLQLINVRISLTELTAQLVELAGVKAKPVQLISEAVCLGALRIQQVRSAVKLLMALRKIMRITGARQALKG